jgi:DNA polymerase-3 subunit gamma/tau
MASLCRLEGFEIADESLGLIALEAGGSMRDALSLLDQLMTCAQGQLSHEQVVDILGVIDRKIIFDLSGSILDADINGVLDFLDDIYDRGHDIKKLYADLLEHFRNLLVVAMGNKIEKLVDLPSGEIEQLISQAKPLSPAALSQVFDMLFKAETSIRLSPQPKLALEMTLIRLLQTQPVLPIDVLIDKLDALRQEVSPAGQSPQSSTSHHSLKTAEPASPDVSAVKPERTEAQSADSSPADLSAGNPGEMWQRICEVTAKKNPSLAANLAKCRLKKSADRSLEIEVPGNGFTLNMIQRQNNMALLQQVCEELFGNKQNIQLTVSSNTDGPTQKKKDNQLKQKAISHPLVGDAVEIFGGKLIDVKVL